MDRRDSLAQLLTDDDVETLKHLAREGTGENSLRALASDLAYLEIWADVATGQPLLWPATEALALKCPRRRRELRADGLLRCEGPMPRNTVKRRLASWSTLHRWKGIEGPFVRRAWLGPAFGGSRFVAAAGAQERAGRHPGCLGLVDRDLRDGSFCRCPGPRDPPLGVRVRRARRQRNGAAARRSAEG